jgi:hypothetical protein
MWTVLSEQLGFDLLSLKTVFTWHLIIGKALAFTLKRS